MANATRLYATLVEGKLNARKFYDTNDLSYYTQEVKFNFQIKISFFFFLNILFSFH